MYKQRNQNEHNETTTQCWKTLGNHFSSCHCFNKISSSRWEIILIMVAPSLPQCNCCNWILWWVLTLYIMTAGILREASKLVETVMARCFYDELIVEMDLVRWLYSISWMSGIINIALCQLQHSQYPDYSFRSLGFSLSLSSLEVSTLLSLSIYYAKAQIVSVEVRSNMHGGRNESLGHLNIIFILRKKLDLKVSMLIEMSVFHPWPYLILSCIYIRV